MLDGVHVQLFAWTRLEFNESMYTNVGQHNSCKKRAMHIDGGGGGGPFLLRVNIFGRVNNKISLPISINTYFHLQPAGSDPAAFH